MKKLFLGLACLLAASPAAWAAPCVTASLESYTAAGFSCSIGSLAFGNFVADLPGGGIIAAAVRTPLAPAASRILVTPEAGPDGVGFTFANLGLSVTTPGTSQVANIDFSASALTGAIAGSFLALGPHATSGAGEAYGYFEDAGGRYLATVADPEDRLFGFPAQLTAAAGFAPVAELELFSGMIAAVAGFGGQDPGSAAIDAYRVLLRPVAVPEPASLTLLAAGVAALGWRRRRAAILPV